MTQPGQAGWYDDPHDANAQRYWDGRGWTHHLQRKAIPAQAPPHPPQMPPPHAPASAPPWMPPPPPGPIAGPGPWGQVRPYADRARDGRRQFWSHQSGQRKIIWALAGVAVAIVVAVVLSFAAGSIFGGGGPSSGGKSTAAFCAELNSLWDGGVRQAHTDVVAEVVSAHQAGAQPISSASLGQTAKNARKLADDAPSELKHDLNLIAQELSTVAAGNIASLPSPPGGDETVVVGWQAANCTALSGNS